MKAAGSRQRHSYWVLGIALNAVQPSWDDEKFFG